MQKVDYDSSYRRLYYRRSINIIIPAEYVCRIVYEEKNVDCRFNHLQIHCT